LEHAEEPEPLAAEVEKVPAGQRPPQEFDVIPVTVGSNQVPGGQAEHVGPVAPVE